MFIEKAETKENLGTEAEQCADYKKSGRRFSPKEEKRFDTARPPVCGAYAADAI